MFHTTTQKKTEAGKLESSITRDLKKGDNFSRRKLLFQAHNIFLGRRINLFSIHYFS